MVLCFSDNTHNLIHLDDNQFNLNLMVASQGVQGTTISYFIYIMYFKYTQIKLSNVLDKIMLLNYKTENK